MKKIINGKKYDTDTAVLIGEGGNDLSLDDFNHCWEYLYQTKSGEFFLYYNGGANSKYSVSSGSNSWSGSTGIIPLNIVDAQVWAEEYLTGDEYESIFGEVVEDDSKVTKFYTIDRELVKKLEEKSIAQGVSPVELLESLIRQL